mmetsp:Transcript_36556/g.58570  ORF Transcript_36556/g.58570 Transcript_36556/m.58570 type:complete len:210 (-) Transcript_36556:352-981(-)
MRSRDGQTAVNAIASIQYSRILGHPFAANMRRVELDGFDQRIVPLRHAQAIKGIVEQLLLQSGIGRRFDVVGVRTIALPIHKRHSKRNTARMDAQIVVVHVRHKLGLQHVSVVVVVVAVFAALLLVQIQLRQRTVFQTDILFKLLLVLLAVLELLHWLFLGIPIDDGGCFLFLFLLLQSLQHLLGDPRFAHRATMTRFAAHYRRLSLLL